MKDDLKRKKILKALQEECKNLQDLANKLFKNLEEKK